jgi:hypothetical protein
MFDDGNRMDDMQRRCNEYAAARLRGLLQQHPGTAPDRVAEFVRAAMEDFWLLHAGRRAEVAIIKHGPGRTREEG